MQEENEQGSQVISGALSTEGGAERRLHLQAYQYWYSLLDGRTFPAVSEMDADSIAPYRDKSFLVDFPDGFDAPVLRFVGADLQAEYVGDAELVGLPAKDVPRESILSRMAVHYLEVLANRAPIGFEAEYDNPRGRRTLYRGILLPFSDDDETIHFIFGYVNWKEVERTREEEIPAEEMAPPRPTAAARPAPPPPPESLLETAIREARTAARNIQRVDGRSREALYDLLAHGLRIHEVADSDPEAYEKFLKRAGLRRQARAPFTPLLKILFGPQYDKTRLTEYATALTYATRQGVTSSTLSQFLMDHEGGIKGCVMQERRARRGGRAKPSTQNPAELLSRAPVLASASATEFGAPLAAGGGFVVLVGRRGRDRDTVEIVAALEESRERLNSTLRRAARLVADSVPAAEAEPAPAPMPESVPESAPAAAAPAPEPAPEPTPEPTPEPEPEPVTSAPAYGADDSATGDAEAEEAPAEAAVSEPAPEPAPEPEPAVPDYPIAPASPGVSTDAPAETAAPDDSTQGVPYRPGAAQEPEPEPARSSFGAGGSEGTGEIAVDNGEEEAN